MSGSDRTKNAIEKDKEKKAKLARLKSEQARFEKAACECFSTAAGKKVLYFLMNECGFLDSSIYFDNNGAMKQNEIIYNEARRNVYLTLRQFLNTRPDILIDVEIKKLKGE